MNNWILISNTLAGVIVGGTVGVLIAERSASKTTGGKIDNFLDALVHHLMCSFGLLAGTTIGSLAGVTCTIAYDIIVKFDVFAQSTSSIAITHKPIEAERQVFVIDGRRARRFYDILSLLTWMGNNLVNGKPIHPLTRAPLSVDFLVLLREKSYTLSKTHDDLKEFLGHRSFLGVPAEIKREKDQALQDYMDGMNAYGLYDSEDPDDDGSDDEDLDGSDDEEAERRRRLAIPKEDLPIEWQRKEGPLNERATFYSLSPYQQYKLMMEKRGNPRRAKAQAAQ